MRNAGIAVVAIAVIFAGGWWYFAQSNKVIVKDIETADESPLESDASAQPPASQGAAIGDENLANFKCAGGKTITAVFERDIVALTLSDGRQMTLRQATSGSGIRYLSNDTKIEFRGKGNEGSLIENGATTYSGCIASM